MKDKGSRGKARKKAFAFVPLCLCAFILPAPLPVSASLSISAAADRTTMEVTDSLYLTVTVGGDSASVPEPEMPPMNNFNVYSAGRSQNISFVNGSFSTTVTFTYILSPRFIGKLKIPPISITSGSDKRSTQEMEITVVKSAAAAAPPGQPARPQAAQGAAGHRAAPDKESLLFMTAETDKRTAYPNEQIALAIRFYTAVPLTSNPQYVAPQFKNLIAEDLPPVRNGETVIKGTRYNYSEIRAALFGIEEGQARVDPASVMAQVYKESGIDPFDPSFFQQFFSMSAGQGETRKITSPVVPIKILPFPAGAPDSFKGAVGAFTFSADLSSREAKTGEAVNLSITISGQGNLKTITAPKLPDMPDFKVYDTMSSLDISKKSDTIGGKKVFTTILIPKTPGKLTIPRIRFSFFDPAAKIYKELSTAPLSLTVEKGEGGGKTFSFAHEEGRAAGITPLSSDIRYVSDKAKPPLSAAIAERAADLPPWLHLLPAGILLLSLWLARVSDFRDRNPLLFRSRKAHGKARADIAEAKTGLNGGRPGEAATLLYDSLLAYLRDKSGHKVSGLTIKRTLSLLQERFPGAGEYAMNEIKDLWEKLEALHFSPSGTGYEEVRDILEKYAALLPVLEKEFSERKR